MSNKSLYEITLENEDIVVKIDRNLISQDRMTKFLDYLELEIIRNRSQLYETDAENLSEQINRDIWSNLQDKLLK
ncbi:hypothetical protein PN466_19725 [Roseofilum reptotaenium CS-1145]|uniref:Uncharacterized protein n=1 Tax=Roseofilum reptotaenium AO1-A TaxID=1925591 RepID=A0A1L9QX88_9CYAN|nr:hypothetical protein [Roseofilum reptotaenium]MDB9519178.1 hypothetical protein [Roseofilum reptotaenium CS-1145]OJJ27311.1 hypothetical protein BI308_02175 [Roseofilum reptotaenium AO1-A]